MSIFNEDYVPSHDPILEFQSWFEKAKKSSEIEPTAMSLATIDETAKPRVRIVLCKEFSAKGFVFYSNYDSNKAKELDLKPYAALSFYWKSLDLQVRAEGSVQKTTRQESEKYFDSRPRESQLSAWASSQSRVLMSRKDLVSKYNDYEKKFADKPIVCPPYWGGYRILPDYFEFWIGEPGRMHNRFQYLKDKKHAWSQVRLYP